MVSSSTPPPETLPVAADSLVVRPFRPLAILGMLLIILCGGGLSWMQYRANLDRVTDQAQRLADTLAASLASWPVESSLTSAEVTLPRLLSETPVLPLEVQRRLEARLRLVSEATPLLQLSLYDPHGKIIFSTDDSLTAITEGVRITKSPSALSPPPQRLTEGIRPTGQPGFSARKTFVLAGRTLSSTAAYRVFTPLAMPEGEESVADLELYVDLQAPMEQLEAEMPRLYLLTAAGLLGLYGGLLFLLHRLGRFAVDCQRRSVVTMATLQESEAHLGRVQDAMENTIAERTLRLKQSEARFREFAESASDWLWECDENARVTYISEGFTRIMGIDRSLVIGRFRWDMSDLPADDEKWQHHRALISGMKPFRDFTYTFRLPNNKRRVVSLNGTPIFDERARFQGFRGTGADITVQYEAEQTILHLGRILEQSANDVLVFEDGALRILQANRGARHNLGYAMDELAEMTALDILSTETRTSLENRLGRLRLYPAEVAVYESVFQRKDGSCYPVEARIQYMEEEKPPVFVAVVQNITARKQAEQALAESEERYRSVAEMSLDAILVHVDGIIVFANQQATVMAHADQATALVGHPISAFVVPDPDRPPGDRLPNLTALFLPQPREAAADGAISYQRLDVRLQRLDGSSFDAEVSSSPIAFGGRPAVQTILRDITQSKVVQGQLIQTAKLATLGEMAAGMAHELSQPMNVIRMAAEGAMLDRPDGSHVDPAGRAALEIISGQAARMGEIIDHMRIFSRKQSDEVELFDPLQAIEQSVSMLESQLRAEDIQLEVVDQTADDQVLLVRGRTVHLEQVLLNLLTNARHALRSRLRADDQHHRYGEVGEDQNWRATITMTLSCDGEGQDSGGLDGSEAASPVQWLVIAVQDSGGGIAPEHLDRIFEPFYTTKEVGTGTGLGLSVSFSLITAMGGTIDAANREGGACFTIRLPLSADSPSGTPEVGARSFALPAGTDLPTPLPDGHPPGWAATGTAEERADGRGCGQHEDDEDYSALIPHVMVVDDEPYAASLVRDHLLRLGYRVSTAEDGEQAYGLFLDDPPDLIITDLRMPRCGGDELIARVHQHVPDLPVIVATGHLGHLETAAAALQEVTVAVIKKPISLAELADLVRRYAPLS